MEMCLAHTANFKGLLHKFDQALDAAKNGFRVMFVCRQGRDRSVLLARAFLQVIGLEAFEARDDMLLLHCSCQLVMLEVFRKVLFLVSGEW